MAAAAAAGRRRTLYKRAGTYFVTLTISDAIGRSASTTQSVTVGAGHGADGDFIFSPTAPQVGQTSTSTRQVLAAAGTHDPVVLLGLR